MVYVGVNELFYGGSMCLGRYSRIKKLVVYFCIAQLIYSSTLVYANPAVALVARPLLSRVLSNVVVKRAATVAANDATYARLVTLQTFKSVGQVAANDARFAITASSSLRHAKDISWVSLALSSGVISLSDLNISENEKIGVQFEPNAVKLSDGRYAINVNGKTKVISKNATIQDPVIFRYSKEVSSVPAEDIYEADNLNNLYRFYYETRLGSFIQANSIDTLIQEIGEAGIRENFEKVSANNTEYSYLSSKRETIVKYLRQEDRDDYTRVSVRLTYITTSLKSNFDVLTRNNTGSETFFTFNNPNENDYEKSEFSLSTTYNINFNPDFQVQEETEIELGNISELNPDLYSQPLTAQQLASLYNALLLSAASQIDYQGIPFSISDPITAQEVAAELNSLGESARVGDLFSKAGHSNSIELSLPEVNSSTTVITPTNPTTGKEIEEIDPSEAEYPELEMPTAEEILDPFKKFFPTLQNFKLKGHSATCPTWSFDIWNKHFTIDSHCELLEEQRQLIQAIFGILWAFIALRHLLTA